MLCMLVHYILGLHMVSKQESFSILEVSIQLLLGVSATIRVLVNIISVKKADFQNSYRQNFCRRKMMRMVPLILMAILKLQKKNRKIKMKKITVVQQKNQKYTIATSQRFTTKRKNIKFMRTDATQWLTPCKILPQVRCYKTLL